MPEVMKAFGAERKTTSRPLATAAEEAGVAAAAAGGPGAAAAGAALTGSFSMSQYLLSCCCVCCWLGAAASVSALCLPWTSCEREKSGAPVTWSEEADERKGEDWKEKGENSEC